MELKENQAGGYYRQQIYDMVQGTIGRTLTINEHNALRIVLKAYANAQITYVGVTQQAPREHKFICVKCGSEKTGKGHDFFVKNKRRIVKDNETNNAGNAKTGGEVADRVEPVSTGSKAPRVLRIKTDK